MYLRVAPRWSVRCFLLQMPQSQSSKHQQIIGQSYIRNSNNQQLLFTRKWFAYHINKIKHQNRCLTGTTCGPPVLRVIFMSTTLPKAINRTTVTSKISKSA